MLEQTPTTVLEAVNAMLGAIGEPPVNTLEDNGVIFAVTAMQFLSRVNRGVQLSGWHWNTEENWRLPLSFPEKNITLPSNTLKVKASEGQGVDVVQRGNRLYDRTRHTYVFEKPVEVDLVRLLPFEEIPEAARNYITIRAARQFQQEVIGSETLAGFKVSDELWAKVELEDTEAETADYNILNNVSIREVIQR